MLDRFVAPATSAWPGSAEEGMHVERRCAGVGVCGRERRAPKERRALASSDAERRCDA